MRTTKLTRKEAKNLLVCGVAVLVEHEASAHNVYFMKGSEVWQSFHRDHTSPHEPNYSSDTFRVVKWPTHDTSLPDYVLKLLENN